MEQNKPFFDPYNFNTANFMPQVENQNIQNDLNINPNSYFDNQYLYYRYLTQMMEYKIRCKEYETLCKNDKKS